MDRRPMLLEDVIVSHQNLIDLYHSNPHDTEAYTTKEFKDVFMTFSYRFIDLIDCINPKLNSNSLEHLFSNKEISKVLPAHLIYAREYLIDFQHRIIESKLDYYIRTEIIRIIFDYFGLLMEIQKQYNIECEFTSYGSRAKNVDSYFAFELAQKIFRGNINLQQTLLEGTSIFTIRQSCELFSKEVLRISKIIRTDGSTYLYGSSLPIKFLAEKKYLSHFNFRYNPEQILVIYKWSNLHIHTGKFSECYIVFKALSELESLFKLYKYDNPHNGMDFRSKSFIKEYKIVQQLFLEYINENSNKPLLVEWSPNLSRYMQYD